MGELEDAVMTRVWARNKPVTVREVLEELQQDRAIAYTTVMTVLDNLHRKGWVRRAQEGRAYRYEAVSTRAAYSAVLMNEAWAESDNPAAALVAFFSMMSPEQLPALRDALRVVGVAGVSLADGAPDAPAGPDVPAWSDSGDPATDAPAVDAPGADGPAPDETAFDAPGDRPSASDEPRAPGTAGGDSPGGTRPAPAEGGAGTRR
nr:BlaI/MecI/CopY family transcriptional regulator [Streptomyces spiramenti]